MRNNSARVFVSYTKRDGQVTKPLLEKLYRNLIQVCRPFIHFSSPGSQRLQQANVIKELMLSHILIIIESPLVYKSPWVKIELLLSRLKMMPIVRLYPHEIEAWL